MTGPYVAIVADPPWDFNNRRMGGSGTSAAACHYETIPTADLCRMPVRDYAAKDSVLFLWGCGAMLPEALEVMGAWGFRSKGVLDWDKLTKAGKPYSGTGWWFRNQAEYLLFGVRGRPPAFHCQLSNVVPAPWANRHSAKPPEVWERIEAALDGSTINAEKYPEIRAKVERFYRGPRLELFARGPPRPGWGAWGDQAEGGIALPALESWAATLRAETAAPVREEVPA